MTVAVAELLARSPHVLLDFDGPVCAIFGGVTDRAVADQLKSMLGLPVDQLSQTRDPFDVLRAASAAGVDLTRANDELTKLEVAATMTATPTPGIDEALTGLTATGHTVTIVSNNSKAAVIEYLERHDLSRWIVGVSARTDGEPKRLKPSPYLLARAIETLSATPAMCVMVGDSASDIEAARAAGTAVIAYANQPGKVERFKGYRPDAVIADMTELAPAKIQP